MNRRIIALTVIATSLLFSSCSGEKKAVAAQPGAKKEGSVPPRVPVVSTPAQPYQVVAVASPGRISGTVDFDGAFPADSIIQPTADNAGCGQAAVDRRIERTGSRVSGVAVWLTDIRRGMPLSGERKLELANDDCVLSPRVQTVMVGGTLNMISNDVAMHHNRIINVETGELEAIAPFNDNGQVIPFDRLLTKTAEFEVVCEQHPWSRAYLLVFDHPYYATTGRNGDFTIDGVPAGTYRLRAWHPELGLVDQPVTVGAGGEASIALKLPGNSSLTPAPASASDSSPARAGTAPAAAR